PDAPPQWLVIDGSSIDDSAGGDGDGFAEPLEEIELLVTLENLGTALANGVTGALTTSDPDVIIDDGTSSFGDIPPSGTADNSAAPFRVTVGAAPADAIVEFDLHVSSTDSRYDTHDVLTLVLDLSQTGVNDGELPTMVALRQNSPNPFRDGTTMAFNLPTPTRTRITVYNVAGQIVATVCDRQFPAGRHSVVWDGTDSAGRRVPAGIYFYRLEAGEHASTKKMILVR
ncbi:MAG: T9SS type A sorting domain-containing protein, partial [Candidatus Eisenbacteria sp.]|nr:T9SS type A sorting domain-containing protein [Candidatus Eisenbacteria bacterium]